MKPHINSYMVFVLLIFIFVSTFVFGFMQEGQLDDFRKIPDVDSHENITVVSNSESPTDGILFFNDSSKVGEIRESSTSYWDLEFVNDSLVYASMDTYGADIDGCTPLNERWSCGEYKIEKLDLETHETEEIISMIFGRIIRSEPHDFERIDDNRYVIAYTGGDKINIINDKGDILWGWNFQTEYNFSSGDEYPDDWTHVNHVEKITWFNKTYFLLSPRNFNRVIFLNKETRDINKSLTLGKQNNKNIINRQHNPDFIPEEKGGPALLVSDSHNDRIVEYQWEDNGWSQSWVWSDEKMDWPRDADRLPNGNTLITDTHGGRVIEVNQNGKIIWSKAVTGGYDAERLGTGEESLGGKSAKSLNLKSRTTD